ncbi:MAG: hypothetical protein L0Z50_41885, partial [Verrucomicrobiales bacterium]|nr:hypothetical protein [Verrucomicrobiales bacterium]
AALLLSADQRRSHETPLQRFGFRIWDFALGGLLAVCLASATALFASEPVAMPVSLPLSPLPQGLNALMPVPISNPVTEEKIALGRRLFFDKQLSRDGTVSCASCHHPDKAFTDGRALPIGVGGLQGRRSAPSLLNSAYTTSQFWDGRITTLEKQALIPLTSPGEMGNTLEAVLASLSGDPSYGEMLAKAFGSEGMTASRIADALATYQRSLVAANTPYDRYLLRKDESALSSAALRGLKLFRGKARCAFCHEGSLFTDQKFHNTGVSWGKQPLDLGRHEFTRKEGDQGKFKTPSLRHLLLTAPYMHDGSVKTLADVLEFYNRGAGANPYLDPAIQPLNLSRDEKLEVLEFLSRLSSATPDHARSAGDLAAGAEPLPPRDSLDATPLRNRLQGASDLVK